jgi:hypothetical protein
VAGVGGPETPMTQGLLSGLVRRLNYIPNADLSDWPASVESACRGHLWIGLDGGERTWNAALVLREFASGPNLRRRISARNPLRRTTALGANCSLRRRRAAGSLAHNRKRRLVRGGHHNFWSAESFPGAAVGRTGTDVTAA